MMDHSESELLARASRYRALAERVMDEQAKHALLDLADRYETQARGKG
jgi:hypothetical protein